MIILSKDYCNLFASMNQFKFSLLKKPIYILLNNQKKMPYSGQIPVRNYIKTIYQVEQKNFHVQYTVYGFWISVDTGKLLI